MSYLSYTRDYKNNLLMLLVRDHKRYQPIVQFFDQVTQNLSELSWAQAEYIASEVSKANHSEFCLGIRQGMINALLKNSLELKINNLEPVIAYALKLNHDASQMTLKDIQMILDAGWSEQTVEDVVALVAIQKLYNTIATGLGFKAVPEEVFTEIGQDTVQQGGYAASFSRFIES